MRNISTAYGRANLNLCTASQGPSASMNSSDIVSLLGCDAALQCDSVAPCVECAVGAPSDVPLLPLLLILVRLLAITAALELFMCIGVLHFAAQLQRARCGGCARSHS